MTRPDHTERAGYDALLMMIADLSEADRETLRNLAALLAPREMGEGEIEALARRAFEEYGHYTDTYDMIEASISQALSRVPVAPWPGDFLTELRKTNGERAEAWLMGQRSDPLFWAVELGGEIGEILNVVKKLVREELGWRGSRATVQDLADEIADGIICLDSLARHYGIDLVSAVTAKFNATSDKNGFPHRILPTEPEWIDWHGGECPVPVGTRVEIECRDGYTAIDRAEKFGRTGDFGLLANDWWSHDLSRCPLSDQIVRYRILPAGEQGQ
jgi:NTP pyrophosphatase (non-canonical NTP hydrolase)